jgi:serine/threonine-protein kinase HipA
MKTIGPRCLALLTPLPAEGLSPAAQQRLSGSRGGFPARIDIARSDVLRLRTETMRHMSISGMQDKISLKLTRGRLAPTESGGTHILKPIPGGPLPAFTDDVPANEALSMHLAATVGGCTVAAYGLVRLGDDSLAYITRRFDRIDAQTKLIQEDCSVLAGYSEATQGKNYKYEFSYEGIGRLLAAYCTAPGPSCLEFFRRVLFSYVVGNGDAHLRNFSVLRDADGVVRLSSAYDLLSTHVHLPNESALALDLLADGDMTPSYQLLGFYSAADFRELGKRMALPNNLVEREMSRFRASDFIKRTTDLIRRSYLSTAAQQAFLSVVSDRLKAIAQGDA